MSAEPVAIGRFATLDEAAYTRDRMHAAGIRCEVVSTLAASDGRPTGFALLVDPSDAGRAAAELLPEHRASAAVIAEGEGLLRVVFAVFAVILAVGLLIGMFRR